MKFLFGFSRLWAMVMALGVLAALGLAPGVVAQAQAADGRCFGAAGQGCGGWNVGEMPRLAFCAHHGGMGVCKISGGSMTHDPCCAANPRGKMCGGAGTETNQCSVEWNRAVWRAVWGYQWARSLNTSVNNTSGVVVRSDYCATRGQGVHQNDTRYCCSSRARSAYFWENVARPQLKVCE